MPKNHDMAPYLPPAESRRVSDEFFLVEFETEYNLKRLLENLTSVIDYWGNETNAPELVKDDMAFFRKISPRLDGWSQEEFAELAGKITKQLRKIDEQSKKYKKA